MTTKVFLPKIDFDPKLDKRQNIRILLNEKNELPSTVEINDITEKLGTAIKIGNIFYENSETQYVFANIEKEAGLPALEEKWNFIPLAELTPETCTDYKIIKTAIKKLGYEL